MNTTLIYAEQSGRLVVSKTLIETAKQVTDMRGAFHAKDILFALESQAVALEQAGNAHAAAEVRAITEQAIASKLSYHNFTYRNRKPRNWIWIEKKEHGWFAWGSRPAE